MRPSRLTLSLSLSLSLKMNAHKLISTLILTFISALGRFSALVRKTRRFPILVKTGELLLALYFRHCGLSPSTIDLDDSTTVHIWSLTHRLHSKPNLVLLHGFGWDSRWQFSSQIRPLSSHFNLFVPDLLFFGKSFTLSPDRTIQNQAKCLMDALRRGLDLAWTGARSPTTAPPRLHSPISTRQHLKRPATS